MVLNIQWSLRVTRKTQSNEDLKNYRPVFGLSFISELVERVAINTCSWLGLPVSIGIQDGPLNRDSSLIYKNEVHLSLARGKPTAFVLLYLSAAFDTIDHSILLSCLQSWVGIQGSILNWFTTYLSESYHSIKIGSTFVWCSSGFCSCSPAFLTVHYPI